MVAFEESLTGEIEQREAEHRALMARSAEVMRRQAEQLIRLIDAGDYAYVGTGRNEPLVRQDVEITLDAIKYERDRRDRIVGQMAIDAGRK
mgnify:CR=1 FL=1